MHPAPVKASAWVRERFPHEVPKRGVPAPAVLGSFERRKFSTPIRWVLIQPCRTVDVESQFSCEATVRTDTDILMRFVIRDPTMIGSRVFLFLVADSSL